MRIFDYVAAPSIDRALAAGSAADARYIAGGTTLLDLMKLGVERPAHLVDINALDVADASLSKVTSNPDGSMRIGALARMSDVAWNDDIRKQFPMVSQSLLQAASGQLRNMASIGGNLLQRTRCYYFRDTASRCNKREPGTGCSALQGINRMHAILGTSEQCIATHASDLAVALAALDASVRVRGAGKSNAAASERTIAFNDFYVLPGAHPERETVLAPGELITAIDIAPLSFASHSLYLKVRDRASYAFALASAAVAVDLQNGVIRDARIAFGGIGTKPWRSREAEDALRGKRADDATWNSAADAALASAKPQRDNTFKVALAKRTLVRALQQVTS